MDIDGHIQGCALVSLSQDRSSGQAAMSMVMNEERSALARPWSCCRSCPQREGDVEEIRQVVGQHEAI